jgi:tRNA A-37 threonylcarbamoyl transferase component Bud32
VDLEKEPLLPPLENDPEDDPPKDYKVDSEHVLSVPVPVIVDTIMKASHDISLNYINRDELTRVVSNLHNNKQHAFSSNDFIMLKKYEDYSEENKDGEENEERKINCESKKDYGVFKNRRMDLIFRIDSVDGQVDYENNTTRILLKKYNNNYKNILQMGIVLPFYNHIQNSSKSPLFPLYYSIQPYINGVTLDVWIEINKYKRNFIEIVYDLFIQLCATIKELHDVDCVHGDLKPGNVLVVSNAQTSQNCVYLIDFGLSGRHLKSTHASGGTLPYCAPETQNTCALNAHNKHYKNSAIFNATSYKYNWTLHNKSHDIWSIGLIFMSIYIFKETYHYYKNYPYDFFTNGGYVCPKYFREIEHEYIREVLSKHVLVDPERRCDIKKLSELLSNMAFM